jgi:flagellar biosynthesis GTPase FlhF
MGDGAGGVAGEIVLRETDSVGREPVQTLKPIPEPLRGAARTAPLQPTLREQNAGRKISAPLCFDWSDFPAACQEGRLADRQPKGRGFIKRTIRLGSGPQRLGAPLGRNRAGQSERPLPMSVLLEWQAVADKLHGQERRRRERLAQHSTIGDNEARTRRKVDPSNEGTLGAIHKGSARARERARQKAKKDRARQHAKKERARQEAEEELARQKAKEAQARQQAERKRIQQKQASQLRGHLQAKELQISAQMKLIEKQRGIVLRQIQEFVNKRGSSKDYIVQMRQHYDMLDRMFSQLADILNGVREQLASTRPTT